MAARKLNPHTQRSHIYSCKRFAAWLKRSPDTATPDEVRRFQLYLVESGASICNRNRIMTGVRFLFRVTLRRHDLAAEVWHIKEPQKLPPVLSPEEVKRVLAMATSLKARAMLTLSYGCGLRASEVVRLRAGDIRELLAPSILSPESKINELGPDQRDFPALVDFYEAGATDYLCLAFAFGEAGDPSHGTGVVYSFTTDRPGGFHAGEIHLLRSTLPGLSLAMKAHAGYDIASGLLRTYLGHDAGSPVHSGAVERGTVDSLHSVLWYADLRGFTRISDVSSGAEIVHMLNDVFETLTAALRPRGGHVLKFIGDAMLATISFDEPDEKVACRRALDAAVEASSNLKARNLEREAAGLPFADVDIALHVGEVLYGNVGAADRLDFTVIGPAVNEVVRIEKRCERLNRQILFSSRFAEAAGRCDGRLELLGQFELRGVGEPKEIFGLRLPPTAALQLGPVLTKLRSDRRLAVVTATVSADIASRRESSFRRGSCAVSRPFRRFLPPLTMLARRDRQSERTLAFDRQTCSQYHAML